MNPNQKGLTLVELLIAMVISLIAMGLAYNTYSAQQRAYTNEQLVLDMQQNARSALAFMRRETRMAGYNPLGPSGTGDVDGFKTVRRDRLSFTLDLNGDGDDDDDNEGIVYRFKDVNDPNGDGIADAGSADLFRYHRQGSDDCSVVAFDIHSIAFAYAFDADSDGQLDVFPDAPDVVIWAVDLLNNDGQLDTYLDTNKDGVIDASDNSAGAGLAAPVPMTQVRAVQVSVLARTRFAVRGHTENETYVVGLHRIAPNDGFKRTLVTGIAMVRNPGN